MGIFEIEAVKAREILDSRGNPTVEVEVHTGGGVVGRAAVPSGKSRGRYEAVELRDGGRRYHGMGVLNAVRNVNEVIGPRLRGMDVRDQRAIDETMIQLDGTENKSRLGANAILGVSLAAAKAASAAEGLPLYLHLGGEGAKLLPIPFMNIINGGEHAGNDLDFQEHMVIPLGARSFSEALRIGVEVYQELRAILVRRYGRAAVNVGDEGGFTPPMKSSSEALEAIMEAVEEMGYEGECSLGLDVAASSLYREGKGYLVEGRYLSRGELIQLYRDLADAYPIVSIEDPLEEGDFEGFAQVTREMRSVQIVGDDLFATNVGRLRMGIERGAANCLLWKVNQVGTLTEALEAADLAKENGYAVQVSHRSGDTEDTFVADLAVGISSGQIKTGAPCRGERTAKYNRLLRIEEELGGRARYPRGLRTP
ncbi:phosphopyruvate hydratase [Candidatus Bathyarchaeota archaeon]|nr:MAG: phosphopyruvate hydratase [Candidatus Bathyarchaeota archaeon]